MSSSRGSSLITVSASSTHFSNSVHSAPAFYITSSLNITGPSVTVTGFDKPFQKALQHAEDLLSNKSCDQVLLVAGDEVCNEMLKISNLWFKSSKEKIPNKWGEGAAAFLLTAVNEKRNSNIKSANFADLTLTEKIFGTTLMNEAFAIAQSMMK